MFSPSEYLTTLNQISLLNGLVSPLPAIGSKGVPVVAAVPAINTECRDIISGIASSPIALGAAAALAGAIIITHLVRKHGPAVLAWFRQHMQQFLSSIKAKLKGQRVIALLPAAQTLVIG
jgi:hypothetical protein